MVAGRVPRMQWLGIGFSDNRRMVSNAIDGVFIYFIHISPPFSSSLSFLQAQTDIVLAAVNSNGVGVVTDR